MIRQTTPVSEIDGDETRRRPAARYFHLLLDISLEEFAGLSRPFVTDTDPENFSKLSTGSPPLCLRRRRDVKMTDVSLSARSGDLYRSPGFGFFFEYHRFLNDRHSSLPDSRDSLNTRHLNLSRTLLPRIGKYDSVYENDWPIPDKAAKNHPRLFPANSDRRGSARKSPLPRNSLASFPNQRRFTFFRSSGIIPR